VTGNCAVGTTGTSGLIVGYGDEHDPVHSGQSMNGALAAAGRAHRPMFEALGYELVEVDFSQPGADASLTNALQSQSIAFVFGVMGMGADFRGTTPDGKESNLWQGLRIPYISLNGDSPAYYFDRHVMPSAWHACLYYYPDHYRLRRRYPKILRRSALFHPSL
jgi:hypothetical protein